VSGQYSGDEQGWPPGLMSPIASQRLHQNGVTKTSLLIQDAFSLDPESFKAKFGACFLQRTQDVQATLAFFLTGAQGPINQQEYQRRLPIALQKRSQDQGFDYVSGPVITPPLDSSQSITLKHWDATEKQLFDACYQGNFQAAQQILDANSIDVNAKDCGPNNRNQTYLYAACRGPNCQPAIVQFLLMNRASTKVPSAESMSLPGHALVANFVDCTRQGAQSYIPPPNFEEYFGRISKIARLLRDHHADFSSMNRYGHSPISELKHEPSFIHALQHPKYKEFSLLIADSSSKKLDVEAMVPFEPAHEAKLASVYELLKKTPKLPEHTCQSISELIWSEHSSEWVHILGYTPALAQQHPLVRCMDENWKAIYFKADTLELKFFDQHPIPVPLVLCNWPQDCTSNLEQPRVKWQWLRPSSGAPKPEDDAHKFITRGNPAPVKSDDGGAPGSVSRSWVDIEDESLINQLKQKKTSIEFGHHKYKLSLSFWVEADDSDMLGKGPICGYRIRWVPDCSEAADDDDCPDTGGCDDVIDYAIAASEYQATMVPISAACGDIFDVPASVIYAPPPIPLERVVNARYQPPPPPPVPNRELPPPVKSTPLPAGWTSAVEPSSGRVYYTNHHTSPPTTTWDAPVAVDSRLEQWFAANSFEPIPELAFKRGDPNSFARVQLRAQTSYCPQGGTLQITGLPVTFFSSNEAVARIEDGQFLRAVGPGTSKIYARQMGNQAFKPTEEWGLPVATQDVNVVELCEFVVSAPETRLKAGYPLLYTRLSNLLNLGPRDLIWSPDLKSVTIIATADKGKTLSAIWASILGTHQVIEEYQSAGAASLGKAKKVLFDKVIKDSPWIPKESVALGGKKKPNVILRDIKEYLQMLTAECDAHSEGFAKEVNAAVDQHVVDWMQSLLDNARAPNFDQRLCQTVKELLPKKTRSTASFHPNICVKVLKEFFKKKVQEKERSLQEKGPVEYAKFESCRKVFETFCDQILQRVAKPTDPFLLSSLIQDFMIHLVSASRGLAFYLESASELIKSVMRNDVTSVTTATGSGKSTLMPLLLLAANIGIKRIAVTQPRRFAAFSIYETISHYHGHSIVGFAMAGEQTNPCAPIVYITDGLLRTQMYLDKQYSGFDCIIIDEVHERSENIDACVALLAKMKELKLKMPKVILSSATLDDKVIAPFTSSGCLHGKVTTQVMSPFSRLLHYPDRHCPQASCTICPRLAQNKFPLSIIRFIHKNSSLYMKPGPTGAGQMLVFMPSTQDVHKTVDELAASNIIAKPLYAGQDGKVQSESLTSGTIFISTNIAETSLTFPNLRVVIDLGQVQRPRLITDHGTLLPAPLMETVEASQATLSQRMGRVGRTCDGHYIALFPWSTQNKRLPHIQAGLELFPTDSVCFSLSKQLRWPSQLTLSFPGKPIEVNPLHEDFLTFPELGSKMMADAFKASLQLNCSEDILMISAFLMKVPPKSQNLVVNAGQKLLPAAVPGQPLPPGDISVLLTIMRMINSIVPVGTPHKPVTRKIVMDSIASWCSKHGLDVHSKPLAKSYLEFQKMQAFYLPQRPPPGVDHSKSHPIFFRVQPPKKSFDFHGKLWNGFPFGRKIADGSPDMRCSENFQSRKLVRGSSIQQVIQALARGYPNNFYVHCAELDGPVNSYSRVADRGDGGDEQGQPLKTYYSLHTKSVLAKADKEKFTVMFAVSAMMFGAEMQDVLEPFRLGALGMAETCSLDTLPDHPKSRQITRRIALHADDNPASGVITDQGKRYCEFKGTVQSTIKRELELRKSLRVEKEKIKLAEGTVKDALKMEQHKGKLQQLKDAKDKNVFKPLGYMWKNLYNTRLEVHVANIDDQHFMFSGRRQQLAVFKKHLEFWGRQFAEAPALSFEADDVFSGIEHFRMPDPKNFGGDKNDEWKAFKKRLHNVTAGDLSDEDILEMTQGKDATRETRMEAVTRIALQTFDCRVVGGFVRDWIVNGDRKHPKLPPKDWVEITPGYRTYGAAKAYPPDDHRGWMKWDFKEDVEVVPKDLDIELMTKVFDVNRFIQEVTSYGITVDHHQHIPQRHIFLFDKDTGPFTADFIEPHFACLHTMGDFNVNCMTVSRFPDQIGLKMQYTSPKGAEFTLNVNTVIRDCRQHQLVPMQNPTVSKMIASRVEKMVKRGWFVMSMMFMVLFNV